MALSALVLSIYLVCVGAPLTGHFDRVKSIKSRPQHDRAVLVKHSLNRPKSTGHGQCLLFLYPYENNSTMRFQRAKAVNLSIGRPLVYFRGHCSIVWMRVKAPLLLLTVVYLSDSIAVLSLSFIDIFMRTSPLSLLTAYFVPFLSPTALDAPRTLSVVSNLFKATDHSRKENVD